MKLGASHNIMKKIALDELDKRILQQLQTDATLSNDALAKRVHASSPTCLRRVKRLRESGVIEKQVAILNPSVIEAGITAIVEITLHQQSSDQCESFERSLSYEKSVQQCYRVSGGVDFIVILQVKDMAMYDQLAHRLFASYENIRNVRCFFSILRSQFHTRLELPV